MAVLVKTPERIRKICEDIVQHFQSKVEPNGFKGQIVTFDRESCLLFKAELDKLLPQVEMDLDVKVVIFRGAGKDFCAHACAGITHFQKNFFRFFNISGGNTDALAIVGERLAGINQQTATRFTIRSSSKSWQPAINPDCYCLLSSVLALPAKYS